MRKRMLVVTLLFVWLTGCGPSPLPPTGPASPAAVPATSPLATATAVPAMATATPEDTVLPATATAAWAQTATVTVPAATATAQARATATAAAWVPLQMQEVARLGKGYLISGDWSPDGRLLALGTSRGVYLHDAASLELVSYLDTQTAGESVVFSPDGRLLAVAGLNRPVRLWDVATGQPLPAPAPTYATSAPEGWVHPVAFSPDGTLLAVTAAEGVQVWSVATGQPVQTLDGAAAHSVAFSPDGTRLAAVLQDHTVQLWETASWQPLQALDPAAYRVYGIAFSPDGALLAVSGCGEQPEGGDVLVCLDGRAWLWEVSSGRLAQMLSGFPGDAYSIAFSPDGALLALGSSDAAQLWDVHSGDLVRQVAGYEGNAQVLFSPDGSRLAAVPESNAVILWDVATGQEIGRIEDWSPHIQALAFSPDGTILAVGGARAVRQPWPSVGTVWLWDIRTGQAVRELAGHSGPVNALAFTPDGGLLASGSGGLVGAFWDFSPEVRLWDTSTGQQVAVLGQGAEFGNLYQIDDLALSPDGTLLAVASPTEVQLWDISAARGGQLTRLVTLTGTWDVDFSADGTWLATGGARPLLWDVAAARGGQAQQRQSGPPDVPTAAQWGGVALSPDGQLLAWAVCTSHWSCQESEIWVWEFATDRLVTVLHNVPDTVYRLTFSPDSRLLISRSFAWKAQLWDVASWRYVGGLGEYVGSLTSAVFSPDNTLIAMGTVDGTVRLWWIGR